MGRIAKILTRVRDSLADPNAKRWSNDRLLRLVDEAQTDIAVRAQLLRTKVEIPIVADTAVYTLPSDAFKITRVISTDKAAIATTVPDPETNQYVIPVRSHAQMDVQDPSWEKAMGNGIEAIIFDKLNPKEFKVYPIPTDGDSIALTVFDSDLGVLTDSTDDAIDVFGVVTDVSTTALLTTIFTSDLGVITGMESTLTSITVYYLKRPVEIEDYSLIDLDQSLEIDEIYDKAIKHYVIAMALRDDKDTQNRKVGNEELTFYGAELSEAEIHSAKNFNSTKKSAISYNNGFND